MHIFVLLERAHSTMEEHRLMRSSSAPMPPPAAAAEGGEAFAVAAGSAAGVSGAARDCMSLGGGRLAATGVDAGNREADPGVTLYFFFEFAAEEAGDD